MTLTFCGCAVPACAAVAALHQLPAPLSMHWAWQPYQYRTASVRCASVGHASRYLYCTAQEAAVGSKLQFAALPQLPAPPSEAACVGHGNGLRGGGVAHTAVVLRHINFLRC